MTQGVPPLDVGSIFDSTLRDESNQPNVVINSPDSHKLIWTLANNQGSELLLKRFGSTKVDEKNCHFKFYFDPGALTDLPPVADWNMQAVKENGAIKYLYMAYAGSKDLSIPAGRTHRVTFAYTNAVKLSDSQISVYVNTVSNVTLGGNEIPNKFIGPFDLDLVQEDAPMLSAPPIAIDFVGKRTLLNDGLTANDFTFAITNMMQADIELTPSSTFSVWFDAAPNDATSGYAWAVAKLQDLASTNFQLHKPSDDWKITPPITAMKDVVTSPRWILTVVKNVILKPQAPVLFSFTGLKTGLDPGVARMYLHFENVANYRPGVLIAELEKSPLQYGSAHGKGLYLSAGTPDVKTPPVPNYDSGLYVQQFGKGSAAVFNGGNVGIGTADKPPAAKLHIQDGVQNTDGGSLIIGGTDAAIPSLRFGIQNDYAWIQSHATKPLAINPTLRNVGIGVAKPGSALSVNGGVAIGASYSQDKTTIGANNLAVEGMVGVHTTTPGSSLSVDGGVAIGKGYAQDTTHIGANNLAVEGKVAINTTTPSALLQISDNKTKDTIFGNTTALGIVQQAGEKVGLSLRKFDDNAVMEFRVYDTAGKKEFGNYIQADKTTGDILIGDTGKIRATRAGWLGLGDGVAGRQVDAGKIGYKLFSDGLDIVGASNPAVNNVTPPRKVRIWDQLETPNLLVTGGATINGDKKQVLQFGAGAPGRTGVAGQIGYKCFSEGLDIVGAVSNLQNRQIHLWDEVYVHGNFWRISNGFWCYLEPHNPVGQGSWDYAVFRYSSDLHLKSNIVCIPTAVDKVKKLRGCTYDWSETALSHFTKHIDTLEPADPDLTPEQVATLRQTERDRQIAILKKPQVGLIAQEVEKVLPAAVETEEDGFKSVNYNHIIALLVEAVKEQQTQIEELKQALAK